MAKATNNETITNVDGPPAVDVLDFAGAIRALVQAIEVGGSFNTAQSEALHRVKVIIGDDSPYGCRHENHAYEAGDRLICQDCREDITPEE